MCTIRKDVSKEKDSAQYVTSFEVNPSRVSSLPLRVMGGVASCAILALSEESIGGKMPDKKAHACFWTRHCPLTCIPTFLLEKKKSYQNI